MYNKIDWCDSECTTNTLLKALLNARVLDISKLDNDEFCLNEACDDWFSISLTKQELINLGNELIMFANNELIID